MQVCVVVVAYNRRELLVEALRALDRQTVPVHSIVVVDNASTDGSGDIARMIAPAADVIRLSRNTGGAGGFSVGIERAIVGHGADLVWIMDDDTIPSPTALEMLLEARRSHPGSPTLMASRVLWTDGTDHPMNTPRQKPFLGRSEREQARTAGGVPVRTSSFVSTLVDAAAVTRSGLPIADYFIWNDDFEFTARLLRHSTGIWCPRSVVTHKTAGVSADPGIRFYYEVRNKIWVFRCSTGLSVIEKPIYAAVSILRWSRTLLSSPDRRTIWSGLRRGLRDGFSTSPRSNAESLAGFGEITDRLANFGRAYSDGR